jgi:HAD superfamily phosphoserine phosphatase-like hydrolase
MRARFAVVFFDLDGTLLPGTSVSKLTAAWLGRAGELDELERLYRDGAISNAAIAETSAPWFAGHRGEEVAEALQTAPWIAGIDETTAELRRGGAYLALATVTWRYAAERVADRYGFDAVCGTEMAVRDGRLTGQVSRHFNADQKGDFFDRVCAERGVPAAKAAAVGDSRSDLPTFARAGFSIALNADDEARAAASVSLDSDDLRDVLPLLCEVPADGRAASAPDLEGELESILLADRWFVDLLRTVREVDPPEWVVGSGVIRNIVWDHLQGSGRTRPNDVDVAIFDPGNLSNDREDALAGELRRRRPAVEWDVTNQAGVHLWYEGKFGHPIAPIRSTEDGVSRWPETATAVAVRLRGDDRLDVVAPCGLEDLFGMVLRRNPRQVTRAYFRERLVARRIRETWPRVTVIDA